MVILSLCYYVYRFYYVDDLYDCDWAAWIGFEERTERDAADYCVQGKLLG